MTNDPEPGSLIGDIVPSGHGEWLTYPAAATRWKIKPKAVYRRIRRGKMLGRKNPETGEAEIWVPTIEEPGSVSSPSTEEPKTEPLALAVPDGPERLARIIAEANERATAPLVVRIEELIRENERLKLEREQRSLWGELWERIRRQLGYN